MIATQNIFAMARKSVRSVVVLTVKHSDNAIAKIVVSRLGCVPVGIRYVTKLADMNNCLTRLVPGVCSTETATQSYKILIHSV